MLCFCGVLSEPIATIDASAQHKLQQGMLDRRGLGANVDNINCIRGTAFVIGTVVVGQ